MQEKMYRMAMEVMENAHAPYSKFKVGVCIKTISGELFSGCNVENVSYGLTQCAEASAIGAMISKLGTQAIEKVVIVSSGDQIIFPCGACRQRLAEFSSPDLKLRLYGADKQSMDVTLKELLPHSFSSF